MKSYAIMPDKNILIRASYRNRSPIVNSIVGHIKENPGVGVVAERTLYQTRKTIQTQYGRKDNIEEIMLRFEELSGFFRVELVDERDFHPFLRPVVSMYQDQIKKIHDEASSIGTKKYHIPEKYEEIANYSETPELRELKGQRIFWGMPEDEDIEICAIAAFLRNRLNKKIFLSSLDYHISEPGISKLFKERFGVATGRPQEILSMIKEQ